MIGGIEKMKWNSHKEYEGKHAFLGASNYHWLNYDPVTLENRYYSQFSQIIGTAMHELAHDCIVGRIRLTKHDVHLVDMAMFKAFVPKDAYDPNILLENLIRFVNDAIGFHMSSEILLFVNPMCFGTTDAIVYNEYEKTLRVHDYKTGIIPAKIEQCHIYMAMFCKEYKVDPYKIKHFEARIYQNGEVFADNPTADTIKSIMDLIDQDIGLIASYLEREGR